MYENLALGKIICTPDSTLIINSNFLYKEHLSKNKMYNVLNILKQENNIAKTENLETTLKQSNSNETKASNAELKLQKK